MIFNFLIILALITIPYLLISAFLLIQNKFNNKFIKFLLKDHTFNLIKSNKYETKIYRNVKAILLIKITLYIFILITLISVFKLPNMYTLKWFICIMIFVIHIISDNLIIKCLENKKEVS